MIGTKVSHYRLASTIGAGGMGVVYLAEDERLNRKVALKFLPPAIAQDREARLRLLHEAQAASALDHPNVATVYDIDEWNGQLFIAMPYYEGETLRQRIDRGPLSFEDAARITQQVALGLAATHRAGLAHRDLKPANVILTHDGRVKIVDFGLAKTFSETEAVTRMTRAGAVLGTVAYMAPEQAQGGNVDARADVWALGVTLYEMLTGRLPFAGDNASAILLALTSESPAPLKDRRPDTPAPLARIVDRALEKDVSRRTLSAEDIVKDTSDWLAERSNGGVPAEPSRTGARWWAIAAMIIVSTILPSVWLIRQNMGARWAREQALPRIEQLSEREDYAAAFRLAQDAKRYIPNDPVWKRIDSIVSRPLSIHSTPAGASVSYRPVGSQEKWTRLGLAPIENAVVPNAYLEWRFEKEGYATATDATLFPPVAASATMSVTLHTTGETPPNMVYVTPGDEPRISLIAGLDHLPPLRLRDFWIDRYEVTNREYKHFVDAGGYRDQKYWRYPFTDKGRTLSFLEAMVRFVDSTGRPGPATWESGNFLEGQGDFPVTGVSWFEAAAYAEFAGKSLPTIFHWSRVADQRLSGFVAPHSNFQGRGVTKVGASGGMNRFGAFDLAGNVKEWCWNRADDSKRYIMGGAWDEPAYMFNDPDARSPFERAANFGFRCVKYSSDDPVTKSDLVALETRDFREEKPASDQAFSLYRSLYDYDVRDLAPRAEGSDDSNPEWRVETVSYNAAYGNERIPAVMYVPKSAKPPYQTVVFFPGSQVISSRSSAQINVRFFDWVMKSGRLLVHPIYKSTFERGDEIANDYPDMTNRFREHVIAWAKDVRRTVDYLETRPDVDHNHFAYLGYSWGSAMAPIYLAVEPRFKAAVLIVGGFYQQRSAPEVEAINFAPRVKIPILLLNGHFDFFYPEDTTQIPMFDLFGTLDADKRRVTYDTGHNIPRPDLIRESLNWLDKYLGPVK